MIRSTARALFVVCALGILHSACSTAPHRAGLAQGCTLNTDCDSGLVCSSGLCHAVCVGTPDCPEGALCVKANGATICRFADQAACTRNSDCHDSLVCGNDGTCRNACQSSKDCVAPQLCATFGFCAEPGEVDSSGTITGRKNGDAGLSTGGNPGAGGGESGGTSSGGGQGSGGVSGSAGTGSGGTSSGGGQGWGGVSGSAGTGSGGASSGGSVGSGGASAGGASAGGASSGGAPGSGGASAGGVPGSGGASAGGAATGTGGSGGVTWTAGNPNGCSGGVPTEGNAVDTSAPTTVVGTGTPASCTYAALSAAVAKGGVITFDCGSGAATILVSATLKPPTGKDTVIDGGRLVTLDGGGAVRILSFDSPGWQTNEHRLTLQHLALVNAKTTPTQAIPAAPAPCSQGWNDGQGGAVYMRDGNLTVVDSIFTGNKAAPLGPDTGGGAIYVQGSKHGAVVAGSTFTQNTASNAGAVGGLFAELHIYDSLFQNNTAVGNGANSADPSRCSFINNGQNEVGSGGNGGAIYSDGNDVNIVLCGDEITGNQAGTGAFGGGLFFTSNNMAGTLSFTDTTMTGNTGGHWTNVSVGTVTNAGTAVGTNCKSITIQSSTLQGVP